MHVSHIHVEILSYIENSSKQHKNDSSWQKYWGYDHYTLTRGEKSHITSNLIQLTLKFCKSHTGKYITSCLNVPIKNSDVTLW